MPDFAANGFLLAGGRSSRMGQSKAMMKLGGLTLLELGLTKLRAACNQVYVVGNDQELAGFGAPLIPDAIAGCGPLGGIVAGLEASSSEWNLFLAVDMPSLAPEVLTKLCIPDGIRGTVCVMATTSGQRQPLAALYARSALPTLRAELVAGRWKVLRAIEAAGLVRFVQFERDEWFRNVNTPEEFAQAEASYRLPG